MLFFKNRNQNLEARKYANSKLKSTTASNFLCMLKILPALQSILQQLQINLTLRFPNFKTPWVLNSTKQHLPTWLNDFQFGTLK